MKTRMLVPILILVLAIAVIFIFVSYDNGGVWKIYKVEKKHQNEL